MSNNPEGASERSGVNGLFIVGAAKSGTTTLHDLVAQHPRVLAAQKKETTFFCTSKMMDEGIDSYLRFFGELPLPTGSTILDSSTAYAQYPYQIDSAPLIKKDFPDARIVYLVRDPVERWISHYGHFMRRREHISPEQVLETVPRLIATSSYGTQLKRYVDVFGRDQILVLQLEELSADPGEVASRVFSHAGLPPHEVSAEDGIKNVGGVDHYIRSRTTSKLFSFPGGERLRLALPASVRRRGFDLVKSSPIGARLASSRPTPVFTEELRRRIWAELEDDMRDFESLCGIKFQQR